MFRKLFFILAAALCAASCLGDGPSYTSTYTLDTHFDQGIVFRSDSLFYENQLGMGLGWQDMAFYHKLNEGRTEFLGGFILSCLKGSGTSDKDRFRVNSGVGMDGTSNYAVYYENPDKSCMPEKDVEFVAKEYGSCSMIGCYVNNTKEVYDAIKSKFVKGDSLAVRMTGYLGKEKTGQREFLLAKYSEKKDSIVTGWRGFNLEKLGKVDVIDIEIISSRNDIPKAFCMDDMMASIAISY